MPQASSSPRAARRTTRATKAATTSCSAPRSAPKQRCKTPTTKTGSRGITPARDVLSLQDERISQLGELGAEEPEAPEAGGNVVDASNAAIAAYRELAGVGSSTEVRAAGTRGVAEIAAVLAAVSAEDPAPTAFVTGGAEDPYEPEVDEPADAATTEDTETTPTTEAGG